jgi:hypothetical protein
MGNARVIAATAQQSAEDYRDAVEQVFREYRIPPGRLLRVRDSGNRMLGEKCIRARIDPAQFDPPPRAA